MRAVIVEQAGGSFRSIEVERPVPAAGEVLVRIRASGVNPLDTKIRAGKAAHAKQLLPAILGMDLAGEVEEVGPAVTSFKRGDRVMEWPEASADIKGRLPSLRRLTRAYWP